MSWLIFHHYPGWAAPLQNSIRGKMPPRINHEFIAMSWAMRRTAFWFLYILGYNTSIAVWVGIIALAGLDAETGVVMLLYLDIACEEWKKKRQMRNVADLKDAIYHGAVKRIRPKIMTVATIILGLLPIMWSHGAGSDVMKRIAAPMIGGVVTSAIMELAVYPAIYLLWKGRKLTGDEASLPDGAFPTTGLSHLVHS